MNWYIIDIKFQYILPDRIFRGGGGGGEGVTSGGSLQNTLYVSFLIPCFWGNVLGGHKAFAPERLTLSPYGCDDWKCRVLNDSVRDCRGLYFTSPKIYLKSSYTWYGIGKSYSRPCENSFFKRSLAPLLVKKSQNRPVLHFCFHSENVQWSKYGHVVILFSQMLVTASSIRGLYTGVTWVHFFKVKGEMGWVTLRMECVCGKKIERRGG